MVLLWGFIGNSPLRQLNEVFSHVTGEYFLYELLNIYLNIGRLLYYTGWKKIPKTALYICNSDLNVVNTMNTDTTWFLTSNVLRKVYSVGYRRHTNTINAMGGKKPSGNKNKQIIWVVLTRRFNLKRQRTISTGIEPNFHKMLH